MINQIQKVCILAGTENGDLAKDLKILSQLIGVIFWCDFSAKLLLRS